MAIKITQLQDIASTYGNLGYSYKDLSLDINKTNIIAPGINYPIPGSDIKVSYDEYAITNSLTNLFNTFPGQRFLFPEYGLSFYQYLFEPITEYNAQLIGMNIFNSIKKYESRVTPTNVDIIADPDNNQYIITINVNIPLINVSTSINYSFNIRSQKFINITNIE